MMNMNAKTVAQDAGSLLDLLKAMGDPAKAQEVLEAMKHAAQLASDSMDKMVAERKDLDMQRQHLDAFSVQLNALETKLNKMEAEIAARMDALRQREEDHATRVKRLRELVG